MQTTVSGETLKNKWLKKDSHSKNGLNGIVMSFMNWDLLKHIKIADVYAFD